MIGNCVVFSSIVINSAIDPFPLYRFKCCVFFRRWILTAGHCLVDNDDIMVYLGMDPEGTYVERLLVDKSKQFIHPKYEDEKLENDIGM